MTTEFKYGDRVRIKWLPDEEFNGEVGTVRKVPTGAVDWYEVEMDNEVLFPEGNSTLLLWDYEMEVI